jgi:hypothetical protein
MKEKGIILFALLTVFTCSAFAQINVERYDLNNTGDGVIIRRISGGDLDARGQVHRVVIPSQIEGFPVVEIGAGSRTRVLTSNPVEIVLPSTSRIIHSDAFYGLPRLTTINLPSGLLEIGDRAFSGCTALTNIIIPEGLVKIGESTFENCSSITRITLPISLLELGRRAFAHPQRPLGTRSEGPGGLVEITIPDGIEVIHSQTFLRNSFLTRVNLPRNLRGIGQEAFYECRELVDILIPETITALTFPTLGGSSAWVNSVAFSGCGKLRLIARQKLLNLGYTGSF